MDKNKNFWNQVGTTYKKAWLGYAKEKMSEKELNFLEKFLPKSSVNVLDIGSGTGRILDFMLKNPKIQHIYSVDIAEKMVAELKNKFEKEKKIEKIEILDISKSKITFQKNFDFISAIRVVQYNKNIDRTLKNIHKKLSSEGVFVFSILNKHSLNALNIFNNADKFSYSVSEIKKILKRNKFELLDVETFTRIPDFFYDISKSAIWGSVLNSLENMLSMIFGKKRFGRILFLAVKTSSKL